MRFVTPPGNRSRVIGDDSPRTTSVNLLKSLFHNIGVVLVGFAVALLGAAADSLLGLHGFRSVIASITGWLLVTVGFLLRVWATFLFYERRMKVISIVPQRHLITSGPYRFSRNPLYLGGNGFIFGGAALVLGSPGGLILTAIAILAAELMIRREEKQLEHEFGEQWLRYKSNVRRWL
jgi:protein-S-isoprenylcysteine O-methyltransferase Ste14